METNKETNMVNQAREMLEVSPGVDKGQDGNDHSVYMDYNATTPVELEVCDVILHAIRDAWGNPSSSHEAGAWAKKLIIEARENVASMVNCTAPDIVFTSGGTEANNMVLNTALRHFKETYPSAHSPDPHSPGREATSECAALPHIITGNIEHDSIKLVLETFQQEGKAEVSFVPVSMETGQLKAADVVAALRPTTCLVTVMMANNETGIIQPIREIASMVRATKRDETREVPRILLHTDAAQCIGKIPVDVRDLCVDFLTIVGHKFYGPRIGALFCSGPGVTTPLYPMFYGGGQERNFRPGTENTGMIAGLGKAAELVHRNLSMYEASMRDVRDYLESRLEEVFGDQVVFNSRFPGSDRLPNTCNVSIVGDKFHGHEVLDRCRRLQASVGAACHTDLGSRPSPILIASGVPENLAKNALRLSVGRETTQTDVDVAVKEIQQAVNNLQSH